MKGTCALFRRHHNVDANVSNTNCGQKAPTGFDGVIEVLRFGCAAFLWILWFPPTAELLGVCERWCVCVCVQ